MSVTQSTVDEQRKRSSGPGSRPTDVPTRGDEPPAATSGSSAETCRSELRAPSIARILGLSVPVSVVLAERNMSVESVLAINQGTIVEFDVPFDSDLVLQVANRPIGAGRAVKVGENFGLRVTRIDTVRDRIDALGDRG